MRPAAMVYLFTPASLTTKEFLAAGRHFTKDPNVINNMFFNYAKSITILLYISANACLFTMHIQAHLHITYIHTHISVYINIHIYFS